MREALGDYLIPKGVPAHIKRLTLISLRTAPTVIEDPERVERLLKFLLDLRSAPSVERDVKWAVAGTCVLTRGDDVELTLDVMQVRDRWVLKADQEYFAAEESIEAWWKAARASDK